WPWSRARGLFAGVALDGAVLSIDDAANEAVSGRDTTPRVIFEGRAAAPPSTAVVDRRDRLEHATALARANRGSLGRPSAATVAPAPASGGGAPVVATTPVGQGTPVAAPGTFGPVDDAPIISEPLPADALPAPLPDPID